MQVGKVAGEEETHLARRMKRTVSVSYRDRWGQTELLGAPKRPPLPQWRLLVYFKNKKEEKNNGPKNMLYFFKKTL